MKKIAIVTDSTCYLSNKYFKENNIEVASLHVVVDGESYQEIDINNEFVFDCLNKGKKVTTSAVAPMVFVDIFQKLIDEGVEDILVFTISSGISGTYQSACIAKDMVEGNIHVYNALVAAYGVELMVMKVTDKINQGLPNSEVIEFANTISKNGHVLFTLTTLDHVVRGGRISKVAALVGKTLGIKPVIEMLDGKLEVTRKSRTNKRIINNFIVAEMVEHAKNYKNIYLRIISLNQDELTNEIEEKLKSQIKNIEITRTNYIGPVFSFHLGEHGYGVTWTAE